MKVRWSLLFLLLYLLGTPASAQGQARPGILGNSENGPVVGLEVPPYRDRVMDLANVLQPAEAESLKGKIVFLQLATTTQAAILIIPDLHGQVLENYSLRVANTWKLGRCDINCCPKIKRSCEQEYTKSALGACGFTNDLKKAIPSIHCLPR
jgi:hypothetical protein